MSIYYENDEFLNHCKLSDFCFLCHKPLTFPAVVWFGSATVSPSSNGSELWLHPNCAKKFAAVIMRDAKEFEIGKQKADLWLFEWKRKNLKN